MNLRGWIIKINLWEQITFFGILYPPINKIQLKAKVNLFWLIPGYKNGPPDGHLE